MNGKTLSPLPLSTKSLHTALNNLEAYMGLSTEHKPVPLARLPATIREHNEARAARAVGTIAPTEKEERLRACRELLVAGRIIEKQFREGAPLKDLTYSVGCYVFAVSSYLEADLATTSPRRSEAIAQMMEAVNRLDPLRRDGQ